MATEDDPPPVRLRTVPPLDRAAIERVGWGWLVDDPAARAGQVAPGTAYLAGEMVEITPDEADALALAGNELYDVLVQTADHVIAADRLAELGVPAALHRLVRHSWEDDRHWHVWGRFDLAGGLGGQPIRLIEFNADTATALPETAILQWAQAQAVPGAEAFNEVYERLVEQFGRLRASNADLAPALLCTGFADTTGGPRLGGEDDANLAVLGAAAEEAGFRVSYRAVGEVTFAPGEGVFTREESGWVRHDFVVKLIPWEILASDEPAILALLEQLILDRLVVVVNPAYAVLLQSKRLLAVAHERFPGHPLLLEAAYTPLTGRACVEKPAYGREGANVTVYNAQGETVARTPGDYDVYASVFQAWTDFPHDAQVRLYQTGLFWAFEACAVGFRRGGLILDDRSAFVGHVVVDPPRG